LYCSATNLSLLRFLETIVRPNVGLSKYLYFVRKHLFSSFLLVFIPSISSLLSNCWYWNMWLVKISSKTILCGWVLSSFFNEVCLAKPLPSFSTVEDDFNDLVFHGLVARSEFGGGAFKEPALGWAHVPSFDHFLGR